MTSMRLDRSVRTLALVTSTVMMVAGCGAAEAPSPAEQAQVDEPAVSSSRAVETATTISFTEGPTVDEAGAVYFTDLRVNNRILKMDPDGTVATFREPSNGANGLIFDSEWRLLAAEAGNGDDIPPRISRTTIETGDIEVLADAFEGLGLHRPNDLTIDGQGRVYFTDRPDLGVPPDPEKTNVHGVYRIDPDGTVARILTEPEVLRPNGIVISPDDTTLYVIETEQQEGGARMIPRLRSGARRHGQQQPGLPRLLSRPQRRRDDDRQRGKPLRRGRSQPPARDQRDARHGRRRPCLLAVGRAD